MQLQAGRSGTNLLLNTLATAVITLAGDPHVDRETVARLDHLAHERGSRRAGRRVRARRRPVPPPKNVVMPEASASSTC